MERFKAGVSCRRVEFREGGRGCEGEVGQGKATQATARLYYLFTITLPRILNGNKERSGKCLQVAGDYRDNRGGPPVLGTR